MNIENKGRHVSLFVFLQDFFEINSYKNLKNSKGVEIMDKIKVNLDSVSYDSKPEGKTIAGISNRIGSQTIRLDSESIRRFAGDVGLDGHTFCPAIFKNGKRNKENFEQQ